ncbi:MAG TPA: metal ABC transporter ATP-binding protein [Phycisphaerae bacterium]|jgi:manganese/zinc/iron transport system ATP- binding protein|nr:metal ABC transporter ATP-binding protein [Phycisphaerae bacterium]
MSDSAATTVPTGFGPDASEAQPPALAIAGLTVSYHDQPVLRDITLNIAPRQLVAVIGPNGAGKSTLLKAVLKLIPVDSGHVLIFGRPINEARLKVAYVPQTETVDWDFPITAGEVVMMGRFPRLGLLRRPSREDRRIVAECLEMVSMTPFAKRHIRQLSGGQQQRIFIARALAQQAEILLLDEPFVGVDARTEEAIFKLMDDLSARGKTLVVVIHDLSQLKRFDSVVMLNRHLVAAGPVSSTVNDENLRRTYGGRLTLLERAEQEISRGPHT